MPHVAINVLGINFKHDDSQTTQISHRVLHLIVLSKRCPRNWILVF